MVIYNSCMLKNPRTAYLIRLKKDPGDGRKKDRHRDSPGQIRSGGISCKLRRGWGHFKKIVGTTGMGKEETSVTDDSEITLVHLGGFALSLN